MKSDLPERTFAFAKRIVKLCQTLDEMRGVGQTLSRQLIRSGASIGANVEEGQASQSRKDFRPKYNIACKAHTRQEGLCAKAHTNPNFSLLPSRAYVSESIFQHCIERQCGEWSPCLMPRPRTKGRLIVESPRDTPCLMGIQTLQDFIYTYMYIYTQLAIYNLYVIEIYIYIYICEVSSYAMHQVHISLCKSM